MLRINKVRCEYKENPIGIDVLKPRLSWQIESDLRSIMQTAYRLEVSMDETFNSDIVWYTGRVNCQQSIHLQYCGLDLEACKRYYFRIKVWDNKGNEADWSETAFWEMELLKPEDWKAEWITPDLKLDMSKPAPSPLLRKSFELNGKIKSARVYATALGLYELHLNGAKVGDWLFTPGWDQL